LPSAQESIIEPATKEMDPIKARRLAVTLVFSCTIIGAAAQMLMKAGVQAQSHDSALQMLVSIFHTPALFAGFSLYGMSAALLVIALKYGELSILYPVIALTYVWVTVLSVIIYHESVNVTKILGLTAVVIGVTVLGRSTRKK
jgi:drug/metabolite transporter (DMT)-like permease